MRLKRGANPAWVVGVLVGGLTVCGGGAAAEHAFGGYRVTVTADADASSFAPEYQVTVEDADMLLTRLRAPFEGTLSNSFVADLNADGRFEVVVTFTHADGLNTEARVFSWNASLLEPIPLTALDPSQLEGYRGGDEFAVSNGELVRLFQVYEQVDGTWTATASRKRLRYSFAAAKWVD